MSSIGTVPLLESNRWYEPLREHGISAPMEVEWCKTIEYKKLQWALGDTLLYTHPNTALVLVGSITGIGVVQKRFYFIVSTHKGVDAPINGLSCKMLHRRSTSYDELICPITTQATPVLTLPLWHRPGISWLIEGTK